MKKFNYDECMEKHGGKAVTRDGRTVRLLCNDFNGMDDRMPVLAITQHSNLGTDLISCFTKEGFHDPNMNGSELDLFTSSKRIQREVWMNIYSTEHPSDSGVGSHITKGRADEMDSLGRLACIKIIIDCEEGEGL